MTVQPTTPDDSNALFPALRLGLPDGRLRRGIALSAAAITAYKRGKALYDREVAKRNWSVVLDEDDDLYPHVHQWLLRQMPVTERRHLRAESTDRGRASYEPWDDDGPSASPSTRRTTGAVTWTFDSSKEATVILDGHPILVAIERAEQQPRYLDEGPGNRSRYREPDKIRFTARNRDGHEAARAFLEALAVEVLSGPARLPRLRIASSWGEWRQRTDLPVRPLHTVILNTHDQKQAVVEDLDRFLNDEDRYNRLGAPYHRGYLFSGPPGGGKTSLARALASYFGLDLYYAPLRDMNADASLLNLVAQVPPRSVLLLEDIDATSTATHDRDEVSEGVSAVEKLSPSGVLNALDGVATPHGMIVMMTSNRPQVLDPALIRPGRIDYHLELGPLTFEQMVGLWHLAYPDEPSGSLLLPPDGMSAADALGIFHRHPDDPAAAAAAINSFAPDPVAAL